MHRKHLLFMADEIPGGNGGGTPPPAAPAGDFVDSMMAEMSAAGGGDGGTPPPATTPPAAPAAPADPPKPAATAAPAAPAPKPASSVAPPAPKAGEPVLDWKSAPKQFKEAHEKLKSEYETTKKTLESQLTTTKQQMQALEQRKFLTPEQETKYMQLEQKQQQLEADLYSRDFRESPEFKAKYQAKADKIFQTVQNELKGLVITENDTQRPATLADFSKVRSLGDSMVEQRRAAKAIFGDDADVVLGMARELKAIEDAANEEIESKRANWSNERKQAEEKFNAENTSSQQFFGNFDKMLTEKFPDKFAPIADNPEFNAALQKGLEFVDTNSAGFNGKSVEERAKSAAIIRRWASSWPANQILLQQRAAKITELEARIAKLQGSDPGAGGDGGAGGGGGSEVGGTDAMGDEIAKLTQQV